MKKELLNKKFITARKENDTVAKNLFSTLKGEFENQCKVGDGSIINSKDQLTIDNSKTTVGEMYENVIIEKLASKMTKNALLVNSDESRKEIELLKEFLPLDLRLSQEEINDILSQVLAGANGNKNVGMLLGSFMKLSKPTGKSVDTNLVKELITKSI